MIQDSIPWKNDLLRRARDLKRRALQRHWPSTSLAKVEREVMSSFYAIRKLIEAGKVSAEVVGQGVLLGIHPPTGKAVTKLNWHRLDELYDLATKVDDRRDLLFVCHQLIHSYVFMVVLREKRGIDGILFASDRQRAKCLYYLGCKELVRVLTAVGSDDPHYSRSTWDPTIQDYRVEVRARAPSQPEAPKATETAARVLRTGR